MVSSDRLSRLQRDLLAAFFRHERRFALTGGAALGGFYLGHRESDDLDLFTRAPVDLDDGERALALAAQECGATVDVQQRHPDLRRVLIRRGDEGVIVDLVVDRAPEVDSTKQEIEGVRLDSMREIAANKICALLGRCQIRDLIDLRGLLGAGLSLEQALADAAVKDGGANPATLAWLLDELWIGPEAPLPGGADPADLDRFRTDLVRRLRRLAFPA